MIVFIIFKRIRSKLLNKCVLTLSMKPFICTVKALLIHLKQVSNITYVPTLTTPKCLLYTITLKVVSVLSESKYV